MFRPQLAFSEAPPGYVDEEFEYTFDLTNTPGLDLTLLPGEARYNICLRFQQDADFLWRGIQIDNPGGSLGVRFRAPGGLYLTDDLVNASVYSDFIAPPGQPPGIAPVVLESEVYCPAGSFVNLDISNLA